MTVSSVEDKDETARWEAAKGEDVRFVELTASVTEWATAFIAAQAELTNPKTDSKANIRSEKGSFSYAYLSLPALIDHVRGVLASHGMGFSQDVRGNGPLVAVFTTVWHTSGHSETFGPLEMPAGGNAQAWGSAITYAKRYALAAVLGIAAEEDDDAQTQVKVSKQKTSTETTDLAPSSSGSDKQVHEDPSEASSPASVDGGQTPKTMPAVGQGAPPISSAAPVAAGTLGGEGRGTARSSAAGADASGEGRDPNLPTSRRDQLWKQLVEFSGATGDSWKQAEAKARTEINKRLKTGWTSGNTIHIPEDDIEKTLLAVLQEAG